MAKYGGATFKLSVEQGDEPGNQGYRSVAARYGVSRSSAATRPVVRRLPSHYGLSWETASGLTATSVNTVSPSLETCPHGTRIGLGRRPGCVFRNLVGVQAALVHRPACAFLSILPLP